VNSRFLSIFLCCCSALVAVGDVALAQTSPPQTQAQALGRVTSHGTQADSGDVRNSRVAATADQIRAVLAKNPGLLVELERVVERETIAKGQLVEDSDLTQEAVFDRLEDDVAFRATATRLLQRYGYLLPAVNPDSELGKEQDLLMKERVHHLIQVEAQEEAGAVKAQPKNVQPNTTSTESCDPRADANCVEPGQRRTRENPSDSNDPSNTIPDGPYNLFPSPQLGGGPVVQAGLYGTGRLSGKDDNSDSSDLLRMATLTGARDPSGLSFSTAALDPNLMRSGSSAPNLADILGRGDSSSSPAPNKNEAVASSDLKNSRILRRPLDGDSPQGTIIRERSPYSDVPSMVDLYVQVSAPAKAPARFGADILSSGSRTSGAILMDMPVGPDYVVGPGDSLAIDLWGAVTQRLQRTVDTEGRISLPEYGPILVSGETLGNIQQTIQQMLRTQLRRISVDVSLSKLRSIRVYVVGEVVEPGAYDISSLSSPLNALVAAGGLTDRGSLREIKHYRGKQLLEVVDAYDLLLRGVGPDQSKLESGDSLLVPPVGPQVTIEGMVRRPAIYELRGNTSLEDALDLAGGVLPAAALKHVEVERLVAHENRTMLSLDLSDGAQSGASESQLRNFQIQDGDRIHIFPIAPYNEQAIYLQGHVLRPGRYSYRDGMTLRDVVASFSDLLPEPAANYAEIIRLNAPDNRPSVESFDLSAALSNPADAPKLRPLDTVRIFSKYDFQAAPVVFVDGEVRSPGKYTLSGQARFRDAIYLAGGITADADGDSAQIFRLNKDGTMKILSVNLDEALAGQPADVILQPRDRIVVQRSAARLEPPAVYIKGDVANPGRYPLTANMSAEDLVRAAGGLKPSADSQSALLAHREESSAVETVKVNLSSTAPDDSDSGRILANGDVLTIPKNPAWNDLGATVTIRGEVQHPGTYGIRPGESLSSVLQKAGGFTAQAYPYGTVLTRKEVRDLEMKSHDELIARMKTEEAQLRALPENNEDEKNVKLTAIAQTETTLTQLESNLPVGRVVLNGTLDEKSFDRTAGETPLHSGDTILVPKKPNYVVVQGQVYNTTAVGYVPGRSANWYLEQAGGITANGNRKGMFVIRADGSVIAAKNNRTLWSGDPLDAELMPGDVVVVPDKVPKVGTRNWTPLMQSAQVATSIALAVAYLRP
jgi:protein involved in polysaccharide export with SLBB domain